METPPRRPPPTPRGRCLLGGELAIPLASPISDRIRTRWRIDENDDVLALNSSYPARPQPMRLDDVYQEVTAPRMVDASAQATAIAPRGVPAAAVAPVEAEAAPPVRRPRGVAAVPKVTGVSAVRRSLRIMGLQKFTNKPESTPAKQVVKGGPATNAAPRGVTTATRRQSQRSRTPKRDTEEAERRGDPPPVQKRHRQS